MARKCIVTASMVLVLIAAVLLGGAGASAPLRSDLAEPAAPTQDPGDYGDAPEGGIAYPSTGVVGQFPTCVTPGPALWIRHSFSGSYLGSNLSSEQDGNAGLCGAAACFPPYDRDECFADGDAGLLLPEPFTIDEQLRVVPCPKSKGTALGGTCEVAEWGPDIDIRVRGNPVQPSYINLLVDWNQDGQWGGAAACEGGTASEHVLVNFEVPKDFASLLSELKPPSFIIGPKPESVWVRFSITDRPVDLPWTGEGEFGDGETEDYLLWLMAAGDHYFDLGDAPDSETSPQYPTLLNNDGAVHQLLSNGPVLGVKADSELDGQPTTGADGDDLDAEGDDEDGVVFATPLVPGSEAWIVVTASKAGMLDAWIDYNADEDWSDPAETLFGGSLPVLSGANNLSFTVPVEAPPGLTYARFRLSSAGGLPPTGPAPDGEVEDYTVTIERKAYFKVTQPPNPELPGFHAHDWWQDGIVFGLTGADDWVCTGGLITDLEWWGNYEVDQSGKEKRGSGINTFHLSIHRADPAGLSVPGAVLWERDVDFSAVHETDTGLVNSDGSPIYMYGFDFDLPVIQVPGDLYWFDVSARSVDPKDPAFWRWQEYRRPHAVLNPVVFRTSKNGVPGKWEAGYDSDMAFAVTSAPADLGDAPDSLGALGYPTLLAHNGAAHALLPGGSWLGLTVDADPDGQPTNTANGDDMDADGDDEDGVTFASPLRWSDPAATATISHPQGIGCFVSGWLDFNGDDDWDDGGEQVLADHFMHGGEIYPLSFQMPGAPPFSQAYVYARFRCSSVQRLGPAGPAPDGEVEDYAVPVEDPYDWGDAPDDATSPRYPTLSSHGGARHLIEAGFMLGAAIDADLDGQPDANAAGDDSDWDGDDEDGVTFLNPLMHGQQACADITLTNATTHVARLYAWVDFNNNGAWDDSPTSVERIFSGDVLSPGINHLCFTVPATATPGRTYARFRLGSSGGIPPQGELGDGEVEDYPVFIEAVKWAQPPVLNTDPQYPACYWGWDELSTYGDKQIVADDWPCTDDRPVTDIHWWGSYDGWDKELPPQGAPDAFHIGIWTDVPEDVSNPFSHPGRMVWQTVVAREMLGERHAGCDYHPDMMMAPDSCFEYHLSLPENAWFHQRPGEDKVYWLSIAAQYLGMQPEYAWGWKTRAHYFKDDAVRIFEPLRPVFDSEWKGGAPITLLGKSWDLAFVLTTPSHDLGDAPDPYPTLFASGGAAHQRTVSGPFMGAQVDPDPDGQPDSYAAGDDMDADGDDEDGVMLFSALEPGQTITVKVDMTSSPSDCLLNAWLDVDIDGNWTDGGEQIFADELLTKGKVNELLFAMPQLTTPPVGFTMARFRCSSVKGLSYWGVAPDGEVEDYRWKIMAPPQKPDVSVAIVDTDDVELSWPRVDLDIYGNAIYTDGYRIYRATAPYALETWIDWVWNSSFPDPVVWDDADRVGDPTVNHYYRVDAVQRDLFGNKVYSARSNEVAEFDFALVPGSP